MIIIIIIINMQLPVVRGVSYRSVCICTCTYIFIPRACARGKVIGRVVVVVAVVVVHKRLPDLGI